MSRTVKMIKNIGNPTEKYRGRILRIMNQCVEFPDGTNKTFEYAERAPGVRIIVTDGSNMLLTQEWRTETQNLDYRLPGGKVFDSLEDYVLAREQAHSDINELCKLAAQRELDEETALFFDLGLFTQIYHSRCGATVLWDLYYYVVKTQIPEIKPRNITTKEGEQIATRWLSFNQVKELCLQGKIQEDRSVAVLLRYLYI